MLTRVAASLQDEQVWTQRREYFTPIETQLKLNSREINDGSIISMTYTCDTFRLWNQLDCTEFDMWPLCQHKNKHEKLNYNRIRRSLMRLKLTEMRLMAEQTHCRCKTTVTWKVNDKQLHKVTSVNLLLWYWFWSEKRREHSARQAREKKCNEEKFGSFLEHCQRLISRLTTQQNRNILESIWCVFFYNSK